MAQKIELLNNDIRQLQSGKDSLEQRVQRLLAELDTVRSEKDQLMQTKNAELDELVLQFEASEKNLASLKRFVEEQTQDRECEREDYNKEITTLKDNLKEKDKVEIRMKSQVRDLENQVSILTEDKSAKDDQVKGLTADLHKANSRITEQNSLLTKLDEELQKYSQMETELNSKLKELSNALDIKLNENVNWQDLIDLISQFSANKDSVTVDKKKTQRHEVVENTLLNKQVLQADEEADNSMFQTINVMNEKINTLEECIEQLVAQNKQLHIQIDKEHQSMVSKEKYFNEQKEVFDKNLKQIQSSNEILREEINRNHLKYNELKVKLDSSVDKNHVKKLVNELQLKLNNEKRNSETVAVKLEQANRQLADMTRKLDSYKMEIKSVKEMLKSYEQSNFDKVEFKHKYDSSANQVQQLQSSLTAKDSELAQSLRKIDLMQSEITDLNRDKQKLKEKLSSVEQNESKIILYEKNMEKLRLQNKVYSDRITYLELEIQNLKKKIELLEQENEGVKMDNYKLLKTNTEIISAASMGMVDSGETDETNEQVVYLNGLDKINSISSSNLLMLKVRRLLSQKRALIYQKNYLIHVLGGFQMTENATLALLETMNSNNHANKGNYYWVCLHRFHLVFWFFRNGLRRRDCSRSKVARYPQVPFCGPLSCGSAPDEISGQHVAMSKASNVTQQKCTLAFRQPTEQCACSTQECRQWQIVVFIIVFAHSPGNPQSRPVQAASASQSPLYKSSSN